MILLIGIIVFFIALIVFIVLSAKKTHWLNLVCGFFVFLFAVFYFVLAGMMMKTRNNWEAVAEQNRKKYEALVAEISETAVGTPDQLEWPYDSVRGRESIAEQMVYGRGRIWKECTPGPFNSGSVTVNLPPNSPTFKSEPNPDDPDATAPDGTSMVFVFLQEVDTDNPKRTVPDPNNPQGTIQVDNYKVSTYIGSFYVSNPADDNSAVTLQQNIIPPDPSNLAELKAKNPNFRSAQELLETYRDPSIRWVLYDILPPDTYTAFIEASRASSGGDLKGEIEPDKVDVEELETFVKQMIPMENLLLTGDELFLKDDEVLRLPTDEEQALIDNGNLDGVQTLTAQQVYQNFINSIVYSNQIRSKYDTDEVNKLGFDPTDEETWIIAGFGKSANFQVDFNATGDNVNTIDEQTFDQNGFAIRESLKLSTIDPEEGENAKLEKDWTILLTKKAWENPPNGSVIQQYKNEVDAQGKAQLVQKDVVYRRVLNDFDFSLRYLIPAIERMKESRDHAQQKVTQLIQIRDEYDAKIQQREATKSALITDQGNFKADGIAMEAFRQKTEAQLKKERAEIDQLYRTLKAQYAKKKALEQKLDQMLKERTRKALESQNSVAPDSDARTTSVPTGADF